MLGLGASGAEAATFQVTNLNDDTGAGSLRKAIDDANLAAGADTVQFASGVSGRIELTQALSITDPVTISGPGANQVTVDGNGVGRVFNANFGNAVPAKPVTISGLTLTGGNVVGLNGGAVYAYGADLTLEDMVVTANSAGISGVACSPATARSSSAIRPSPGTTPASSEEPSRSATRRVPPRGIW